ncbi:hypothetical protein [uncultured Mediterranean phage uvMED]|nr:hypothetical protein [uncultured Mediterranean phage uvMED]
MRFKKIGDMFNQIDQEVASAALLGTIKAAEKTVKELQQEGPSWTGQFSNSWQITGPQGQQVKGDGQPGEPRPVKFMTAPFTGQQAAKTLFRTTVTTNKVVFTVSNFSPWAGEATDLRESRFYRPTPEPETRLGLSKWERSGQRRPSKRHPRYQIFGGGSGDASRTAPQDWFTKYVTGGRLDKSVTVEMDNMLRRL